MLQGSEPGAFFPKDTQKNVRVLRFSGRNTNKICEASALGSKVSDDNALASQGLVDRQGLTAKDLTQDKVGVRGNWTKKLKLKNKD